MYINEAAKLSGITKKAIEYYCQKGLLDPALSDKGYRIFSAEDVEELKKISLLRSLGISFQNIPELIHGNGSAAFQKIVDSQLCDIQRRKEQNDLLKELAVSMDWDTVNRKVEAVEAAECRGSIEEMNRVLLQNFNSVIHKNDTVYILVDICHHMKIEDADELSYGSLRHYNAGGWYDHEFSHL